MIKNAPKHCQDEYVDFDKRRFLIIGGTTKAGTTSLYRYLKDHPQICASALKETRFFLDADSPLPVKTPFDESLEGYREYFSNCLSAEEKVLMEATPDYLYSRTALRIADLLPNAKMVFVLRDPVDRMISWFKYARQCGLLDSKVSFEEYVKFQFDKPVAPDTPGYYRALEEGCYSRYLGGFKEKMPNRILLLSFDELKRSPVNVMRKICDFSNLDSGFYDEYEFLAENVSQVVKYQFIERLYLTTRRYLTFKLINNKWAMFIFRWINRYLKAALRMNRNSNVEITIDEATLWRLKSYYEDEIVWMKNEIK